MGEDERRAGPIRDFEDAHEVPLPGCEIAPPRSGRVTACDDPHLLSLADEPPKSAVVDGAVLFAPSMDDDRMLGLGSHPATVTRGSLPQDDSRTKGTQLHSEHTCGGSSSYPGRPWTLPPALRKPDDAASI